MPLSRTYQSERLYINVTIFVALWSQVYKKQTKTELNINVSFYEILVIVCFENDIG